jgi:hypothetical protein
MTPPAHSEAVEGLLESKRVLDMLFDRFVREYEAAAAHPKLHRFDLLRYLDKARTEIELAEHWLEKLRGTMAQATQAAAGEVADQPRSS